MQAAASARSIALLPDLDRLALDRVQSLAETLHEDLVVWDLATRRGRKEAHHRGIHDTPCVVYRSGRPESLEAFQAHVGVLPQGTMHRAS